MIIDTHCHLDDNSYDDDLSEVLARAKTNGVEKIIIPGADIKDLEKARKIANSNENIYFAVGVHPYHCNDFDLSVLETYAKDDKCVAVGECGLDYYRLKSDFNFDDEREANKKLQKDIFLAQIDLASRLKKPLIVHIRDANEDSYEILKANSDKLVGGVLHCFNASRLLLGLKDFGFSFGIGGVLTFKNARNLVEILPEIPIDKILIETDGPYLSPEPFRGKRNEPSFTKFVVEKISDLLKLEVSKIEKITTDNAIRLFFNARRKM